MKDKMRKKIITKIKAMNTYDRKAIEDSLCTQLIQSTLWQNATVIGITHATGVEWDTESIMQRSWEAGKKVTVPKVNPQSKTMNFYAIQDMNELESGYANILEPHPLEKEQNYNKEIDLLIVPGLMFDQHGYRLGFGGGFYDRYLADPHNVATTVSLVAEFQLVAKLPVDYYDIPIDYIITEYTCIKTTHHKRGL